MKRTAYLGCSLLLTAALAVPTFARQAAPNDGAAYTTYFNIPATDLKAKVEAGEKFIADFKASQYADPVYRQTVDNYAKLMNWPKVLELAGKLEALFPKMEVKSKARVYSQAMVAAQQSNNAAETIAYGEKVIAIAPEDLNTLITLSSTIPQSTPTDKAALGKAEGYATKALGLVTSLNPASIGLSPADWEKQKAGIEATLHTTLGSIAYNNMDYPKAEEHLLAAIKATPTDGGAWYLLGLVYNQQTAELTKQYTTVLKATNDAIAARADQSQIDELKAQTDGVTQNLRTKRDQAIDALATAVAAGGATMAPANTQLQKLWSGKNAGSMDGLDAKIAERKQWLATQG